MGAQQVLTELSIILRLTSLAVVHFTVILYKTTSFVHETQPRTRNIAINFWPILTESKFQ